MKSPKNTPHLLPAAAPLWQAGDPLPSADEGRGSSKMWLRRNLAVLGFLMAIGLPSAQCAQPASPDADLDEPKTEVKGPPRFTDMDYGPFFHYTVADRQPSSKSEETLAIKGLVIKLGGSNEAAVCFDTETLRMAAGWTGGFLDLTGTHMTSYKGSQPAFIQGAERFSTRNGPGWANAGVWTDPRPHQTGPLPAAWAKYHGLYRCGEQIVLAYTVGGVEVLEQPGYAFANGLGVFSRTFHLGASRAPLTLLVCEAAGALKTDTQTADAAAFELNGMVTAAGLVGAAAGTDLEVSSSARIQLKLPALTAPATFRLAIWSGPKARLAEFENSLKATAKVASPQEPCRGGPPLWLPQVVTRGRLGFGDGAYVVDTLTIPENNPWRSWMRLTALDFFSDGRAAVSTWNGDVWIVSGIDHKLEKLAWKRFAAGLFEPLGLKIVDDKVCVRCRDQIVRLHDLNNDGEADYYECFNNDGVVEPNYHAFAMDLDTDRAGNFYYTRCGQRADPGKAINGALFKVAKDGSRQEIVATGLRAANGLSIGPNGEIACGDNQGNWIPSSRINLVKPGGFYGYMPHHGRAAPPAKSDEPICWLPMTADNSSGGQAWVTSEQWGPFQGHLLHTSYGRSSLLLVMQEEIEGQVQGGVVLFPLKFDSGIMRGRFHPRDGQLYVCGLKGWQTTGARDGALQRVRYTGKPVHLPVELHVVRNGISITFTEPLEAMSATDEQNYAVEQWNYKWSEAYGSPDFSAANPSQKGRDTVRVQSVRLSPDRKTVFLEISGLQPVMQMRMQFRIKAADGASISREIFNTINRVPS